jgi:hypothetical protein
VNPRARTLRARIDEVEGRVALRQERIQLRWHDVQHAALRLVHVNRTLPVVATGAAVLLGYLLLRKGPRTVKAGGLVGALVTAGLGLLRPRYGALISLAWQLLSRRRSTRNPPY